MNKDEVMNCGNCKFGYIKYENRKIKEVFCRELNQDVPIAKYKNLRFCLIFKKKEVI